MPWRYGMIVRPKPGSNSEQKTQKVGEKVYIRWTQGMRHIRRALSAMARTPHLGRKCLMNQFSGKEGWLSESTHCVWHRMPRYIMPTTGKLAANACSPFWHFQFPSVQCWNAYFPNKGLKVPCNQGSIQFCHAVRICLQEVGLHLVH